MMLSSDILGYFKELTEVMLYNIMVLKKQSHLTGQQYCIKCTKIGLTLNVSVRLVFVLYLWFALLFEARILLYNIIVHLQGVRKGAGLRSRLSTVIEYWQ